ncbi:MULTISPECIES: hypothetical protein [unclassified Streptomyces]|uniref:hypothetical protein n=1 Tax=unclassified Streptomyces TaxID=2593676 RepID=UPI0038061D5C
MSQVVPWSGLDSARFGEKREVLRERLGVHASFVRVPGSPPIDHYIEAGLLLTFDASDRLVFIEATGRADLTFSNVRLLRRPFGEVVDDLSRNGVNVEIDDSGGVLEGTGIALYTPAPDEPELEVEGVSIFSSGRPDSEDVTISVESADPRHSAGDIDGETLF